MKRAMLKSLLLVSLLSILFTACADKKTNISERYNNLELKDAPSWVMTPMAKGYMVDIGSASQNAGNDFSFQREEAMADARNNLAKQVSLKVNSMFKIFKSATGSNKDATFDKASETVSKQIASQTLSGTKVTNTWISGSGTLYVLMIVDTKVVQDYMQKAIKTSFNNDKAMYQKFLASKAQEELAFELEKLNQ